MCQLPWDAELKFSGVPTSSNAGTCEDLNLAGYYVQGNPEPNLNSMRITQTGEKKATHGDEGNQATAVEDVNNRQTETNNPQV